MKPMKFFKSESNHFYKKCVQGIIIQCLPPDHYVLRFFLRNFRKLSTKSTTKLENSSDRYGFWKYYRTDLVLGTVNEILNSEKDHLGCDGSDPNLIQISPLVIFAPPEKWFGGVWIIYKKTEN